MATPIKSRDWCFTLNNYTEAEITCISKITPSPVYLVYGKEVGESGTPHLQGYIYFTNQISFSSIKKKMPTRTHLEKTIGTPEQASTYCKKDGTFIETGDLPQKQGKRNDLTETKKLLMKTQKMKDVVLEATSLASIKMCQEILKYTEIPRNFKPVVVWVYGPTGVGKSKLAYDVLGRECYTTMDTGKWWEGYDAHERVHIEDMRKDFLKFHQLLKLLDRYPYRIETKGGSRQFVANQIIITSCYSPTEMYDTREDVQQLIRRIDLTIHIETGEQYSNCVKNYLKIIYSKCINEICSKIKKDNSKTSS